MWVAPPFYLPILLEAPRGSYRQQLDHHSIFLTATDPALRVGINPEVTLTYFQEN